MKPNVAVLGASQNPERYSHRAVKLLEENGYPVFPVHPSQRPIGDTQCYGSLGEVPEQIDTLTVYVGPQKSTDLAGAILEAAPRRVILNPGAENAELERRLEEAGIVVQRACTLVLLQTGQF